MTSITQPGSAPIAATATRWTIDPSHSLAEFGVKHMMITTVKGRFTTLAGTIDLNPADPSASVVEVTIDPATIATGIDARDAHLRSADFFDVEQHPAITFRSTRVSGGFTEPGDAFTVSGELTMHGVTREVTLDVEFEGRARDGDGERIGFSATTKIDRRDYGLTWNQGLETGGVLVGHEVKIALVVQAHA